MTDSKNKSKKVGAGVVFSWIFSLIFIFTGLGMLIQSKIVAGIFFLLAGIIINPAFKKFLKNKLNLELSKWLIFFIMLACLIVAFSTINAGHTNNPNNTSNNSSKLPKENSNKIPTYSIKEPFVLGNLKYTLNSVETKDKLTKVWGVKKAEGTFLIINMTMKNIGNEPEYVNDEIYVIDSQGRKFENDYESGVYLDEELSSIEKINPSMSKTGQLVFDIPTNLSGEIGIKENMWNSNYGAFIQW